MTVTSNASLIDTTVWLVFVYLGYRVLTIVLATRRRRCQLHAAIRSWKDLLGLDLPVMFARMQQKLLTTRESNPSPSFESPGTRVASTESLSPYSECGEDNVFSLAERMLDHELNGRSGLAEQERRIYLNRLRFRVHEEAFWETTVQRMGLLGTVIGAAEAFAVDGGIDARMGALAFALGTTAVGLVMALIVHSARAKVFAPAYAELTDTVEECGLWIANAAAKLQTIGESHQTAQHSTKDVESADAPPTKSKPSRRRKKQSASRKQTAKTTSIELARTNLQPEQNGRCPDCLSSTLVQLKANHLGESDVNA